MPAKIPRKALRLADLESYFGSARKAHTYRAARRNATIHKAGIERRKRLKASRHILAKHLHDIKEPAVQPKRMAWWQFWK